LVLQSKITFITKSVLLDQGYPHCPKLLTAASIIRIQVF